MDPHRIPTIITWGIILLGIIAILSVIPYQVDDAFITYRYAKNLNHGIGPVFNQGDPSVEGFSSPLWLLLITFISLFTGWTLIPWIGTILGISACLLCIWLTLKLTVESPPGSIWHKRSYLKAVVALPLLVLLPPFVFYGATGLESAAFCAVILGFTGALTGKFSHRTGIISGFLALWIRPEGFWLVIVMICFMIFRKEREIPWRKIYIPLFISIIAGGTVLLACRLAVFRSILPNTYYAKPGIFSSGLSYALKIFVTPWGMVIFLLSLMGMIGGEKKHRAYFSAGISWIIAAVLEGGDWMPHGRLLLPAFMCLIMATPGILLFFKKPDSGRIRFTLCCIAPLIIIFSIYLNGLTTFKMLGKIDRTWNKTVQLEHAMNRWISLSNPRSVGSVDIGRLGFYLTADIVDFSGLTDGTIGRSPGTHLNKSFSLDYIFVKRKPHLIVLRLTKAPRIIEGQLKSLGSGSPVETRIIMDSRFADDYSFGVAFLPPASENPYYGKLIFYRKDFPVPGGLIPPGRIIPLVLSKP